MRGVGPEVNMPGGGARDQIIVHSIIGKAIINFARNYSLFVMYVC